MYLACDKLIQKHSLLKGQRYNFEDIWQSIADYMVPMKNNITKFSSPGEAKMNNIYDSTAMISVELLAGALHGMLTSPTSYFFGLSTGNPELDSLDTVRLWIQDTVRRMHDALNNSNFQTEVHEYYIDLCAFGNGALFMEDDDKDTVRFSSWPLGEMVIDENYKGEIDSVYRQYKMTCRDIVTQFDKEGSKIPEKVQKCYAEGKNDEFEILHAIYPKTKEEQNGEVSGKFPWLSRYIFVPDKSDISVGGFREFPLIFGRWSKVSGEMYARGPGEKALPETKTINEMTRTTLRAAQKVVDPPLQMPDDGFIMPIITRPAGINYYRPGSQDRIEPIFNGAQVDFGFQAIDLKRAQIREAFYVNQLMLREGPQMTAYETSQRIQQALRFLSPMLGRQQSEFLSKKVARLYSMMSRKQLLLPVPPELDGVPLNIVYSSVMAMAQRASEMDNINRTFAAMTPLASMSPTVFDNFEVDKSARYIAKLHNFPQEMLRNKDGMDSIRKMRAEQQQKQQSLVETGAQAESLSKVMTAANKTQAKAV